MQTKRVCVCVADKVKVMVIESLHWWQISTVLLRVRGQRHRWVGDAWASGRAVPREVTRRALLKHGLCRAVALVLRGGVQLAEVVRRFWHRADGAEHRLRDYAGLGLQKGENSCVLDVLSFCPVLCGQVMDKVLHTLVVSVVEVVCKFGQ